MVAQRLREENTQEESRLKHEYDQRLQDLAKVHSEELEAVRRTTDLAATDAAKAQAACAEAERAVEQEELALRHATKKYDGVVEGMEALREQRSAAVRRASEGDAAMKRKEVETGQAGARRLEEAAAEAGAAQREAEELEAQQRKELQELDAELEAELGSVHQKIQQVLSRRELIAEELSRQIEDLQRENDERNAQIEHMRRMDLEAL